MRSYEYRYVVGFEDTNVVGNVYYANHIRWQGRCREMFLRDHAPKMLDEIEGGLALVTLRVSCEYFLELAAFDEVVIRMRLGELSTSRMTLRFEYWLDKDPSEQLAARGEQELACMLRREGELEPVAWPVELTAALEPYRFA
jgi:enediyne biosynthesis thioesterase